MGILLFTRVRNGDYWLVCACYGQLRSLVGSPGPLATTIKMNAVRPSRLAALTRLRCQIFQTSYNPTGIRTGAKYLRQRLRGPSMVEYYPRELNFAKIARKYPILELVNEAEEQRLLDVEERKKRGKGAPKKAKSKGTLHTYHTHNCLPHVTAYNQPIVAGRPKNVDSQHQNIRFIRYSWKSGAYNLQTNVHTHCFWLCYESISMLTGSATYPPIAPSSSIVFEKTHSKASCIPNCASLAATPETSLSFAVGP